MMTLLLLAGCKERQFKKSLEGEWKLTRLMIDELNHVNYDITDTLFSDSCGIIPYQHSKNMELIYRFAKKGSYEAEGLIKHRYTDTLLSLNTCSEISTEVVNAVSETGTYENSRDEALALISGKKVDNFKILSYSHHQMILQKDLDVDNGMVRFNGGATYHLEKIK
jgi:hypothetical protein